MVVQVGNTIEIPKAKSEEVVIRWQQNFANREKTYYAIPFTVVEGEGVGTLFAEVSICCDDQSIQEESDPLPILCGHDSEQKAKIKSLIALGKEVTSDDPFSGGEACLHIKVTSDFRYGQDAAVDTKIRFLVYGDKSDNPYQHRFMSTSAFQNLSESAIKFGKGVPGAAAALDTIKKLGEAYIGDPLREF